MKQRANFDTTYCTSLICKHKCWRHVKNYEFEENNNYWFQEKCKNEGYPVNIPVNEENKKL